MGKSSPRAPAAPDPARTAAAQTESNQQTALWNAILNNVNQITPWGNLTWTQNPATVEGQPPTFTSTITLSPQQQAILDSMQRQDLGINQTAETYINQIAGLQNNPYSYEGIPGLVGEGDVNAARQQAEEAMYSRLNPQMDRDREALMSRLINQGIAQGSDAYNREMDAFNRNVTDTRLQVGRESSAEADRLIAQSMALRNQGIQEYDRVRNAPINEFNALRSQTQLTAPQFQQYNMGGAAPTDVMGAYNNAYNAQMNAYNQQQAGRNSMMGSLFGLGGQALGGYLGSTAGSAWLTGLLASDQRLKENVVKIGENAQGLGIYDFNYIGHAEKRRGVMAQEVESVIPEAVKEIDGVKYVDYTLIDGAGKWLM